MQIQQRNGRHRSAADMARQPADIVKTLLRCRVQNGIFAQCVDTTLFGGCRVFHYVELCSKLAAIKVFYKADRPFRVVANARIGIGERYGALQWTSENCSRSLPDQALVLIRLRGNR